MIKNHLIIVTFNLPWDWTTDYTNQTAKILSRDNTVICCLLAEPRSIKEHLFSGGIPRIWRKIGQNLYVYEVIHILPFRRFNLISNLNIKLNGIILNSIADFLFWKQKLIMKILWVFDPQFHNFYKLFGKDYYLIYDCVDFFSGSSFYKEQNIFIKKQETKLLKNADFVCTISHTLKSRLQSLRSTIYIVPQGFRDEDFIHPRISTVKFPNNRPILGYIGAINYRLDFHLLNSLIRDNPQWNFIFVGTIQPSEVNENIRNKITKFLNYENFYLTLDISKTEIPDIIKQFDIALVPYDINQDFNRYSYPMKLFEYFYVGKPVVATPIEELKRFPQFIKVGKSATEWKKHIENLLQNPWPEVYRKEQKKLAIKNSWGKKIEAISKYMVDS